MRWPISCAMLGACGSAAACRDGGRGLLAAGAALRPVAVLGRRVDMVECASLALNIQPSSFNARTTVLSEGSARLRTRCQSGRAHSTSTIGEQRRQLKRLVSRRWNVMAQPGLCQDFQGRTDLAAHAWKALFAAHIARHDAIVLKLWNKAKDVQLDLLDAVPAPVAAAAAPLAAATSRIAPIGAPVAATRASARRPCQPAYRVPRSGAR